MRSFPRLAVLPLFAAFVLVGMVPDVFGLRGTQGGHPTPTWTASTNDPQTVPDSRLSPTDIVTARSIPLTGDSSAGSSAQYPESDMLSSRWARSTPVLGLPAATTPALANSIRPFEGTDLFVHVPPNASRHTPLRVVVALHGIKGRAEAFAQSLAAESDRNGWLLIAPSLPYRNWMDPDMLLEDDLQLTQRLQVTLDTLPARTGLPVRRRVMLFGFSRGAQLAHRFALFFPERVESVVALSAGSYTLPKETRKSASGVQALPLPYGVGDLSKRLHHAVDWAVFKSIAFWVGVGQKDDRPADVPRAFDSYCGTNRVERARAFVSALESINVDTRLVVFPNAGHEITREMRDSAIKFLSDHERAVTSKLK